MFGAGTDRNISIHLNGEYCNTLKFRLYKSLTKSCLIKNKFEISSLERFEMEHDFVGNIYKAKLFKETNLTAMEDWYVEYVQIIVPSSGKIYTFNINS
ncbi:hypothetical protein A3Q56_07861 [Intoshia linei]|uniref:PLAT domain-containing protein n=1 Tax=Intoshia linei TaxID=1819745 RepID=A0A177AR06_9BILA|nr:hypothetical protein A3Q56_07861 [Intoshia linei]